MPEVFVKALNLARNVGRPVRRLTTVDMDFIRHYRPGVNVVARPTATGGTGHPADRPSRDHVSPPLVRGRRGAPLITLTTDFGIVDPFVGIMKGVIAMRAPGVPVVDVSHGIPAQNVMAGALVLKAAAPYFPAGTVHVAVVDPGVGTTRRAICIETAAARFVGPDNGLLTLAARPPPPGGSSRSRTSATSSRREPDVPRPRRVRAAAAALASGVATRRAGAGRHDVVALDVPCAVQGRGRPAWRGWCTSTGRQPRDEHRRRAAARERRLTSSVAGWSVGAVVATYGAAVRPGTCAHSSIAGTSLRSPGATVTHAQLLGVDDRSAGYRVVAGGVDGTRRLLVARGAICAHRADDDLLEARSGPGPSRSCRSRVSRAGSRSRSPLLAILLCHELGPLSDVRPLRHRRVLALLPARPADPLPWGTFGAFIRVRSGFQDRRALFDMGAAGPWAGFVVSVAVLIVGLRLSHVDRRRHRHDALLRRLAAHGVADARDRRRGAGSGLHPPGGHRGLVRASSSRR
jgi:hypothetical protein